MDKIKKAFSRVKEDLSFMKSEIGALRENLFETREKMIEICRIIEKLYKKIEREDSTHRQIIPTSSTHFSTHNLSLEPLKPEYLPISTGNRGVSTDRQTDTSTDRQTQKNLEMRKDSFENASNLLSSLDELKKEIRLKFKRLTAQEVLVFSTIYQLEEERGYADYRIISERLNLTESSVRDYIGRLIKKGIPIEKKKINNKTIHLFISKNLKKIATLSTILHLREI